MGRPEAAEVELWHALRVVCLDTVAAAAVEANLRRELHGRTVLWLRHQEV